MANSKKLKGLLAENNMTQKDLAVLIDTSANTVHRKLTGKSEFSLSEVEIIAEYFHKTIDEIFFSKSWIYKKIGGKNEN